MIVEITASALPYDVVITCDKPGIITALPNVPITVVVEVSKNGLNGKSNYQIAVDNGYVGTELEWLDSQKNIDGGLIF